MIDSELQRLLEAALQLPQAQRAALAGSILESLDELVDDEAEELWQLEIARRSRELDDGSVKPIPWAEARRRIVGG